MSKAKTLNVFQALLLIGVLMLVPVVLTLFFITPSGVIKERGVKALLPPQIKNSMISSQVHLDAYAKELGELQARMMRLDAQSVRLAKMAGEKGTQIINNPNDVTPKVMQNAGASKTTASKIKASKTKTSAQKTSPNDRRKPAAIKSILPKSESESESEPEAETEPESASDAASEEVSAANRGGPLVKSRPFTEPDLQAAIAELTKSVDMRDEKLSALEAKILQQSVLKEMLPNSSPVQGSYNSSSYGWRVDPFDGSKAFHEGLDYPAATGAAILAAADGIVTAAESSAGYGNMVKIDHGFGLETRYAHASKIFVKVGDRVVKGQAVAAVGSTGRSTGPHLHFEIRLHGNSLDPRQYLPKNAA